MVVLSECGFEGVLVEGWGYAFSHTTFVKRTFLAASEPDEQLSECAESHEVRSQDENGEDLRQL